MIDTEQSLKAILGDGLKCNHPMAPLTSFGTGGPARYFFSAATVEELTAAVEAAKRLSVDYFLIGGGSNLLVSDEGFDGLIIKVDIRGLRLVENTLVEAGAGVGLADLVEFTAAVGLTGLEFAAGIWGTVGGAVYGNAGAYGGQIGDVVRDLMLVDCDGRLKEVSAEYCRFGYRGSYLKRSREVIASARFSLAAGDEDAIRERIDEILALRQAKFPSFGTAGCFFKNIPDPSQPHGKLPAGKLLEEAGAKGLSVGRARVYDRHANIIVAEPGATSKDIRRLADKMKEKVKSQFGIRLEEEIIMIGRFTSSEEPY